MSKALSPDEVFPAIPELAGKSIRWQELRGGLTNRSFKICTADRSFVLRLDDVHTATFGLDRRTELKARTSAFKAGIAAEVVFADIDRGILLSEFLPGDVWNKADLGDKDKLVALADTLQKVHTMPSLGTKFDARTIARRYADSIVGEPELHVSAQACVETVSSLPVVDSYACSHNDVVAENVVAGPKLKLLDWEYACDNDPMYDLASLIAYHKLDDRQADILFSAYAGGPNPSLLEQLQLQLRLYEAIQWLWFAVKGNQLVLPCPGDSC
jgi:thiamine kinase-like enzyme